MISAGQESVWTMAAGVTWWQILLGIAAGALAGLASGVVVVGVERFEKLEAEELEDRAEYEKETAAKAAKAKAAGEDPPAVLPWQAERYGWTWSERFLAPALGALAFGAFTFHQGVSGQLVIRLVWVTLLLHIFVFDLKHHLVLDIVTLPSLVVALALAPFTADLGFDRAASGAILCAITFMVLYLLGGILFGPGAMGFGDVKLAVVIGAITGFDFDLSALDLAAVYAIFYAVLLGGLTAIVLMAVRFRGLKDAVAYAPFLCVGTALVLYMNLMNV